MTNYLSAKFNSSEVLTLLSDYQETNRNSDIDTTLTESFVDPDKLDISDVLAVDSSFTMN